MSEPTAADRIQDLQNRYRSRFAGQPRITRDITELKGLISDLEAISAEGDVAASLTELKNAWTAEADAIAEAQKSGAGVRELQSIEQWYNEIIGRYSRNFAGQGRETRDVGLLAESNADLTWLLSRLDGAPADTPAEQADALEKALRDHQTLATNEINAIRQARTQGEPGQRAMLLAKLANDQFARYRVLFANQQRTSRRMPTLDVIIKTLTDIRDEMVTLGTVPDTPHTDNMGIVDRRLGSFQTEAINLKRAIAEAPPEARALALGDAANKIFADYRDNYAGKPRSDADLDKLNELWEQLWLVSRELADLSDASVSPTLQRNLQITRDMLRIFAREYTAIKEAKAT